MRQSAAHCAAVQLRRQDFGVWLREASRAGEACDVLFIDPPWGGPGHCWMRRTLLLAFALCPYMLPMYMRLILILYCVSVPFLELHRNEAVKSNGCQLTAD